MMTPARLTYKPGWAFKVGGPDNAFLCVMATTPDSQNVTHRRTTQHMFRLPDPLPAPDEFNRWVLACLLLCEQHEACEFFRVDGRAPFHPHHQDEGDPYELVERSEAIDGTESAHPWPDSHPVRSASDLLRRAVGREG